LTSKKVLATVNLKSIGDVAAAKTTLVLPGASTDYTFKTASGAVTISTKAVGTTKAVTIASLDLTTKAIDTPLIKFSDLTAKFQAATTKLQAALVVIDTPAVPTLLKDTGISAIDGISNDGTLNVSAKTVGGIISYSIDGGKTFATGALPEGVYAAGKISVVEKATNGSISKASSNAVAITVDKTAPAAATKVALDTDTGLATDNITSDGTINITGTLEVGARWEFSVNGGTTFTTLAANATSFVVPATAYAADQIQVKQVDAAGNSSAVTKLATALTVDETAAVPSIALATDTGTAGDGITTIGTVNVTGIEAGAKWQYTTGGDYIDGTGTSFTLLPGFTYDAGQINVRQTDIAGNESDADGKFGMNSIDWTIVSPEVAINSTNLTATGTASADIYAIASGSYAATINSFAAGDKLQIFQGASITVPNDANLTDGIKVISITDLSAGTTATITLNGLTPVQDADLFNLSSFDIFGTGTVKIGNANTAPATTTNITGSALTGTGTDGVDTFNVASGSYIATIANFKPGDKLKFFTGAAINVIQDNNNGDGYQEISATDPNTGATAIIALTGLTAAQDDGAFNIPGFNNVFGAGTIA
jgi:hypothetical protein